MDQNELIRKNLQPLRLDAMPAEKATDFLTKPFHRMSSVFRRTCHYARWNYFVSTNTPKPIEAKLSARFSGMRIDKLHRQLRRVEQRIQIAQGRISRIQVEFIRMQAVTEIMLPLLCAGKALVAEINRRAKPDCNGS